MPDEFDFAIEEPIGPELTEIDPFVEGFNDDIKQPSELVKEETAPEPPQRQLDPRVDFINGLAAQHDMDADQYMQAVQEERYEREVYNLMAQGVDEDAAYEILETRQMKAQQQYEAQAKQQQQDTMFNDFLDNFKTTMGREFDADQDTIPEEAWRDVHNGSTLKDAYEKHSIDSQFLAGFNSI